MFRNPCSFWCFDACHPCRQAGDCSQLGLTSHVYSPRSRARVLRLKKKTLILFELLIALSLVGVLITLLFSFFVESARLEKKLDAARFTITKRAELQTRLDTVFTTLDSQASTPCLSTQKIDKEHLLNVNLIFDNGIDPDPEYSGSVEGHIYLDSENNLCLTIKPFDEKSSNSRTEVLLGNVVDFDFEFLGPKGNKKDKEKPVTPELSWKKEWEGLQGRIPSMIRLQVRKKNEKEPLQFAVFLPSSDALIQYVEKKAL